MLKVDLNTVLFFNTIFFFFFKDLFTYLFSFALSSLLHADSLSWHCCCVWASYCSDFFFGALAVGAWALVLVACRFSFSVACGIFLDQGGNPCTLYCKVGS